MIFRREMLAKVLSGAKTVTRRVGKARYKMGRTYAVQPGRGRQHVAHIKIRGVQEKALSFVDKWEVYWEGFDTVSEFVDYWIKLHGTWDSQEVVTRIRFELAPSCPDCAALPGVPA